MVVSAAVRRLAQQKTPVITLDTLVSQVADRKTSSTFMHQVLPPLLARMAVALGEEAPSSLASMPSIESLVQWYADGAVKLAALEPPPEWGAWRTGPSETFLAREKAFGRALEDIRADGATVRSKLVRAVEDTGGLFGARAKGDKATAVDDFLSGFYARRLTLRLLLGQYKACRDSGAGNRSPRLTRASGCHGVDGLGVTMAPSGPQQGLGCTIWLDRA